MAKSNKRPIAVFLLSRTRRIGDFIIKVRGILTNMGDNALIFTTPMPALLTVETHVSDLDAAEARAQTRAKGSAAARDLKYEVVLQDVRDLTAYVQKLADGAGDEASAVAIIQASGLNLKVNGVYIKPPLAAKNGLVSGTILLTAALGGKRGSHEWQMSLNNQNWTGLPPTTKASTQVENLTPLSVQHFRHRLITNKGPEEWSQSVSVVVL
jgi:hypothetical protein